MKQFSKYKIILIICFCIWIITTTLQISNPHPYRGLIGNIILVIGLILYLENCFMTITPIGFNLYQ